VGKIASALKKAGGITVGSRQQDAPVSPVPHPEDSPPLINKTIVRPEEGGRLAWNEMLVAAHNAADEIAEKLRVLRTKILHPEHGSPPRSILITSAVPGEGKTFLTANLAITLAQSIESHVLIIDADLRRSGLGMLFGIANTTGLSDHLRDNIDVGRLLVRTGHAKLSILPAGPAPINPAELLDTRKTAAMFAEMAKRYEDRYIIIDSPPLNLAAETAVLAKYVDRVILVVRYGFSNRELIQKAVDTVGKDKILGIVFNAAESSETGKKYGYYYGEYYGRKK